ncbi:Synovial apoptosis inhibitor 1, synoviolin-like [Arapaima gigas]
MQVPYKLTLGLNLVRSSGGNTTFSKSKWFGQWRKRRSVPQSGLAVLQRLGVGLHWPEKELRRRRVSHKESKMVRAVLVTVTSFALTVAVVAHAYYLKHQFYPTVVYLTKSSPSMAVLYIQAFVLVFLLGKFMRKVFFGQLRAAEMEHLIERSWYAVTETCLAFTVFRDDFSPRFVALFTLLLFLKCFHWLAEDRVDFVSVQRKRTVEMGFVTSYGTTDLEFVFSFLQMERSPNISWLFHFRYAILLTMVLTTFIKYTLHTIDLQSENPWDNKAVYMLYTELFTGFIKVLLYMAFMTIMIKVHTFPLFAIRPMYLAMRQFKKAVTDAIMSRRAIRNMNTLYPDATPEDLQATDNVCIICREEMVTGAKKLPCNHIFHSSCLRSWFQRQQTCPTCRMDVLRASLPNQTQAQPPAQPAAPPPAANAPIQPQGDNKFPPGMMPPFPPGLLPFWGPFLAAAPPVAAPAAQAPADAPLPGTEGTQSQGAGPSHPNQQGPDAAPPLPGFPFSFPPPLPTAPWLTVPPPPPFMSSMPPPPASLSSLSEAELRELEQEGRRGLEARLQCLQNIHTLLDAAMLNIHHYLSTVATLSPPQPESASTEATAAAETSSTVGEVPTNSEATAESADGATGFTSHDSATEEDGAEAKEDGEPNAAELRKRRLRKLETAAQPEH